MASVTAPRNAAPARLRATASHGCDVGGQAGGDQADRADDRGDEVERGRELAAGRGAAPARPATVAVDAGHGRHPGGAPVVLGLLAATRPRPCGRSTRRGASAGRQRDGRAEAASRTGCGVEQRRRRRTRRRRAARNTPPRRPAVAEADLAVAGRDPQEEQPAGRPLQQHRGGVEADHSATEVRGAGAADRRRLAGRRDSLPSRASRLAARPPAGVAAAAVLLASAGCATGERPTLGAAGRRSAARRARPTGNAAVDAVLAAARAAPTSPTFTADLRDHPQARTRTRPTGTVVQDGAEHLDHGRRRPLPAGHPERRPARCQRAAVRGRHARRPDQRLLGGLGLLRPDARPGPCGSPTSRRSGEPTASQTSRSPA